MVRRGLLKVAQGLALLILCGTAAVLFLYLGIAFAEGPYLYEQVASVPEAPVAIVLGASVSSTGALSPVMKERADMAAELYRAHKVARVLVTGDNSTLQYDEVYPVGKYLVAQGIPEQDIFLDYAGFDTYSSMYRARHVFGVTSAVIVTQRFHLPRALFLAHELGVGAVGIDAGTHGERYLYNSLREVPACVKAVIDLFYSRVPRYLGPQFFVTGDGRDTWVGPKAELIYFEK